METKSIILTRSVAAILIGASVVWIVWLLSSSRKQILISIDQLNFGWLGLALVLGLLAAAMMGEIFHLVSKNLALHNLRRSETYALQYVAILTRNLPGRFWGIAYQIAALKGRINPSALVMTQGVMVLISIFSIAAIGMSIFPLHWAFIIAFLFIFPLLVMLAFSLLGQLVFRRWIAIWRPSSYFAGKVRGALSSLAQFDNATLSRILAVNGFSWAIYLGAWACLGMAHPGIDPADGVRLAGYYGIAWLAGFFAIFTPSGFGVREISFLTLASSYPAEVSVSFVLLARVWFLFNDIALGTTSLFLFRIIKNYEKNSEAPSIRR